MLIDSGATHNFIHNRTVKEKNLYLEKGNPFAVTIGDGTKCTGKGVCKRVELELQGVVVVADFFAIELGNVDVILGMQWLDTTGTMKIHWPSLTMSFWLGKQKIILKIFYIKKQM